MPKRLSHRTSGDGSVIRSMLLSQLSPAWLFAHYGVSTTQWPTPIKRTREFVRLSWVADHLGLGRWAIDAGVWPTDAAKGFVRQHPSKRKAIDELHQQLLAEWARIKSDLARNARVFRARRRAKRLAADVRRCLVCDAPLKGKNGNARYCSTVCRVKHARRSAQLRHH
jgi:hypothetical protein